MYGYLRDEMPKEMVFEIFEQADTTKLFDEIIKQQEINHILLKDYPLPVENNPEFVNLCQHLAGYSVVDEYEIYKQKSKKLSFDFGVLTQAITQSLSSEVFQQRYAKQLRILPGYGELVKAFDNKISATIIGLMLSCDLFAHALAKLGSEAFRISFGNALRETKVYVMVALTYRFQNPSQLSSATNYIVKILWDDRDDPIQVRTCILDILQRAEQLQKQYDRLKADFLSILNEDPFPGSCNICRPGS